MRLGLPLQCGTAGVVRAGLAGAAGKRQRPAHQPSEFVAPTATLVSTAYNVGIAAGAAVGAGLLTAGVGYALLPTTGIVCSSLALVTALISLSLSRRAA